jgi:hypothetical protein
MSHHHQRRGCRPTTPRVAHSSLSPTRFVPSGVAALTRSLGPDVRVYRPLSRDLSSTHCAEADGVSWCTAGARARVGRQRHRRRCGCGDKTCWSTMNTGFSVRRPGCGTHLSVPLMAAISHGSGARTRPTSPILYERICGILY